MPAENGFQERLFLEPGNEIERGFVGVLLDFAVSPFLPGGISDARVILGGDYVGSGGGSNPAFPISDLYNEIDSTLAPPYRDVVITYGSHDENCTDGYSAFFSGPRHQEGYYVYGISYAQMIYATDKDASDYNGLDIADRYGLSAESATANFAAWVRTLTDNSPIVVMSHVPMHANRRDNLGATAWYNVLTEAAEKHDIVFLWGHNHTNEEMALREQQKPDDSTTQPKEEAGQVAEPVQEAKPRKRKAKKEEVVKEVESDSPMLMPVI